MKTMKKGMTIIELLMVITIIGILAAILIPILGKIKDKARTVECMSRLKSCYNAITVYASEWNGRFVPNYGATPSVANPATSVPAGSDTWGDASVRALENYFGTGKFYAGFEQVRCPLGTNANPALDRYEYEGDCAGCNREGPYVCPPLVTREQDDQELFRCMGTRHVVKTRNIYTYASGRTVLMSP